MKVARSESSSKAPSASAAPAAASSRVPKHFVRESEVDEAPQKKKKVGVAKLGEACECKVCGASSKDRAMLSVVCCKLCGVYKFGICGMLNGNTNAMPQEGSDA